MKKLTLFILFVFAISACSKAPTESRESQNKRAEMRHKIFIECMELAAKNGRQGDDDVSDLVTACQASSYYLVNSYDFTEEITQKGK